MLENFHRTMVFCYYLGIELAFGCSRIKETLKKSPIHWLVLIDFKNKDWYYNFLTKKDKVLKFCKNVENEMFWQIIHTTNIAHVSKFTYV